MKFLWSLKTFMKFPKRKPSNGTLDSHNMAIIFSKKKSKDRSSEVFA